MQQILPNKRIPELLSKLRDSCFSLSIKRGATWNRTRDTRIFSPMLYQLSYGTLRDCGCKDKCFFLTRNSGKNIS